MILGAHCSGGVKGALDRALEIGADAVQLFAQSPRTWRFPAHDPEYQTLRKASYSVLASARAEARRALAEAKVEATIFESGEDAFDVVPPGAGKAPAARFAADRIGTEAGRLVTAGDALIDADLLRVGRGIAVGNATPELLEALDGSGVYRAVGSHAAGVLEGLRHHGAPIRDGGSSR